MKIYHKWLFYLIKIFLRGLPYAVTVHPFRIVPVFEKDPPLAPHRRGIQEIHSQERNARSPSSLLGGDLGMGELLPYAFLLI